VKKLLLIAFILLANIANAQTLDTILKSFTATLVSDKVVLNWLIKGGNSCNGIAIYRSTDGFIFNEIGDIAGICGGTVEDAPYQFIDVSPFKNKFNYYKIELGNYGFSKILSVQYINISEKGYLITPNPINNQFTIYFKNPESKNLQFELFNTKGDVVKSENINKKDYIEYKSFDSPSGIYFFKVSGKEYLIQGKFVKI
jgi:Secretion system C-terminal sorting domain